MKVRVTMLVEVSDIPEQDRDYMAKTLDLDNGEEVPVPTPISNNELSVAEVEDIFTDVFSGLGEEYDHQAVLWEGTGHWVWFSKIEIETVKVVEPDEKTLPVDI